jgi:hypothetical protein
MDCNGYNTTYFEMDEDTGKKLRNFLENDISLGHDISQRADRLKG